MSCAPIFIGLLATIGAVVVLGLLFTVTYIGMQMYWSKK